MFIVFLEVYEESSAIESVPISRQGLSLKNRSPQKSGLATGAMHAMPFSCSIGISRTREGEVGPAVEAIPTLDNAAALS